MEGEGALHLRIRSGAIETLRMQIYEPPRLFEKLLEGRSCEEVPDMVARICGICPVAYQISAVNALEDLFGIDPGPWVQAMRRVLYCGEWIQSHALHIHLLAAPDYFGYDSAIAMARDYPDIVRRGLALQGLGNAIMTLLGARSVHPVGVKVGGFHHAARPDDVAALLARLRAALPQSEALVRWAADMVMPDDDQAFTCVSMRDAQAYPIHHGQIVASDGLTIDASAIRPPLHRVPGRTLHGLVQQLSGPAVPGRPPGAAQSESRPLAGCHSTVDARHRRDVAKPQHVQQHAGARDRAALRDIGSRAPAAAVMRIRRSQPWR